MDGLIMGLNGLAFVNGAYVHGI